MFWLDNLNENNNKMDEKKEYHFIYSCENLKKNDKKKKLNPKIKKYLSYLIAIFLFLFFILFLWLWQSKKLNFLDVLKEKDKIVDNSGVNVEYSDEKHELSPEHIYEICSKSVVPIAVYDNSNILSDTNMICQGSGVIANNNGCIFTNAHVVAPFSKLENLKIVVLLKNDVSEDGSNKKTDKVSEIEAKIVGLDKRTDLAVIKIDKSHLKDLRPAVFANSDKVRTGQTAYVLGNPCGLNFQSSMTRGIVSATNRSIDSGNKFYGGKSKHVLIQSDAAMNPGNSGGALLNSSGQVIGLCSSKVVDKSVEGMGFAIAANFVREKANDIMQFGYVKGYVKLGITGHMISAYRAEMYDVPVGMLIVKIDKESWLNKLGVEVKDIITKINGIRILDSDAFYEELHKYKVGAEVMLTIYKISNHKTRDVSVPLIEDRGDG